VDGLSVRWDVRNPARRRNGAVEKVPGTFERPVSARFSRTRGTPNSPASRAQTVGAPPRARENSGEDLDSQKDAPDLTALVFGLSIQSMEWVVLGGICVALVVFGFVKHVYYVAKNVWAIRRAFDKPTPALPPLGLVTITGIVSSMGDKRPVQVKLREAGTYSRGQYYWEQKSRVVQACPFALLIPEAGARIIVEPDKDVYLRSLGHVTKWKSFGKNNGIKRFRIGALEDGDRAIITGVLSEKRTVESQSSEYRSQKGKVKIEYVLRPIPGDPLKIDSETMLEEISERFGYIGWARALGTVVLVPYYCRALWDSFADRSANTFWGLVVGYGFLRLIMRLNKRDRVPWFDRTNNPKKPHHGLEHVSDYQ